MSSSPENGGESVSLILPNRETDEALVRRCRLELPSCTEAYRELVSRYHGYACAVAGRLLDSPEDAEEVAQDALVQVFHRIHQFEPRMSFKTWLHGILQGGVRKRLEDNAARKVAEASVQGGPAGVAEPGVAVAPEDLIQLTLQRLDDSQREILVLRFYSEMSLEDMAKALDIGLSATKMRLYRALEAFKSAWKFATRPER